MAAITTVGEYLASAQEQSPANDFAEQARKLVEQTNQKELSILKARDVGFALITMVWEKPEDYPFEMCWIGLSHLLQIPSIDLQEAALGMLRETFFPVIMKNGLEDGYTQPILSIEAIVSETLVSLTSEHRSGTHPMVSGVLEIYEDILEQVWTLLSLQKNSLSIQIILTEMETKAKQWIELIPKETQSVIIKAYDRLNFRESYEALEQISQKPGGSADRIMFYAELYGFLEDHRRARIIYKRALKIFEGRICAPTLAHIQGQIGILSKELGDYSCAVESLRSALTNRFISESTKKEFLRVLIQATYFQGDLDQALQIAQKQRLDPKNKHDEALLKTCDNNTMLVHFEHGDFLKASKAIKRFLNLAIRKKWGFNEGIYRTLLTLCYCSLSKTRNRKKKDTYIKKACKEILRTIQLYESQGDDSLAKRIVSIALTVLPPNTVIFKHPALKTYTTSQNIDDGSFETFSVLLSGFSSDLRSRNRVFFKKLKQLNDCIGFSQDPRVNCFGSLPHSVEEISAGTYSPSRSEMDQKRPIRTFTLPPKPNPRTLEDLRDQITSKTTKTSDLTNIAGYLAKHLNHSKENGLIRDQALADYLLGVIYRQLKNFEAAEEHLEVSIQAYSDILNKPLTTTEWKAESFEALAEPIRALEKIYLHQDKHDSALELSERRKAPSLEKMLARKGGLETTPPMSIHDMQALADRLRRTFIIYTTATQTPQNTTSFGVWIIRPNIEKEFRKLDAPIFFGGVDEQGIPALPKSAFDGGKDGDLDALFANLPSQDLVNDVAKEDIAFLENWHRELIAPIADLLPYHPDAQVTFVPEGPLCLVPFHILRGPDGRYLIQDHTISMAPSLNSLRLIVEKESPDMPLGTPLIFGEPDTDLAELKFAQDEIDAVLSLHQDAKLVTHAKATPACFEEMAPQASRIHVSLHGTSSARTHDYSVFHGALCCTPEGEDGGDLYASRIKEMDLVADLVFLSACQTGQGQVLRDGIFGLVLAFLAGGARSVVGTLWNLKDSELTVKMVRTFYTHINEEKISVAKALRQAMLLAIELKPLSPLDWGALFATGEA